MPAEKVLNTGSMEMDYITFGKGSRPLVMIQGLNTRSIKGSGLMLSFMYRIFAKDYKVYIFDRRKNITGAVTIKELAEDTAAAMDALNITRADIIGVSQGGMIAQYLAIERPDLVNRMVLAVTLGRNNDTVREVICRWISLCSRKDFRGLTEDMAVKMYSDSYIRRYRPFLPLLAVLQKPEDIPRFTALARSCLTCDTYDSLDRITCPVMVIGGSKDKVVTGQASEELASKLGCRLHMYSDLGHAAYEEAKDFNAIAYSFLREPSASGL